ncbi:Coiled-coil domain-containing protein 42 like-2 [Lamellibrachia satsuma]|nr:Coiled-coil domain-containing protein 42 like-2 [Lamellibrachia satsuma]
MAVNLEDYFRSTFEDELLVKMPEHEDDHLTPATRLLEKRREMAEVEQALAAQKEEFQMKMESLQQRREELERKEYQLKESLLKFDKFLKENDSKRGRAIKKANDERELKKSKEREIYRLKDDTAALVQGREKLQKKLEKHTIYHKYLDRVLESAEEFHEIREIIARYDTLTATHLDLLTTENENQDRLESEKQDLMKYREEKNNEILDYCNQLSSCCCYRCLHVVDEKNNEILGFNNQLAVIQTKLDKAQSQAVMWESQWTHIKTTAAKKTLLLGRIKMAAHNLYQLVVQHQRSRRHEEEDTEDTNQQLDRIQQYIMDLNQITADIKKAEALAASVTQVSSNDDQFGESGNGFWNKGGHLWEFTALLFILFNRSGDVTEEDDNVACTQWSRRDGGGA